MTEPAPLPPLVPPWIVSAVRYAVTGLVGYLLARAINDPFAVSNVALAVGQLVVFGSWLLERYRPDRNLRTWAAWIKDRLT